MTTLHAGFLKMCVIKQFLNQSLCYIPSSQTLMSCLPHKKQPTVLWGTQSTYMSSLRFHFCNILPMTLTPRSEYDCVSGWSFVLLSCSCGAIKNCGSHRPTEGTATNMDAPRRWCYPGPSKLLHQYLDASFLGKYWPKYQRRCLPKNLNLSSVGHHTACYTWTLQKQNWNLPNLDTPPLLLASVLSFPCSNVYNL